VCARDTEAVIVKRQLLVQLLLKEVTEIGRRWGVFRGRKKKKTGGEESRLCQTERAGPHTCAGNYSKKTQIIKSKKEGLLRRKKIKSNKKKKTRCARLKVEGLKLSSG